MSNIFPEHLMDQLIHSLSNRLASMRLETLFDLNNVSAIVVKDELLKFGTIEVILLDPSKIYYEHAAACYALKDGNNVYFPYIVSMDPDDGLLELSDFLDSDENNMIIFYKGTYEFNTLMMLYEGLLL